MEKFFNNRRNYSKSNLDFKALPQDPLVLFHKWFVEAQEKEPPDANAFALATTGKNMQPSCRYLLLKAFDKKDGFIFFTNYESKKGKQITENNLGAMAFFWPIAQRQVRIEGIINILSDDLSDEYFKVRPQGSKIGAWASPQSKPIPSREYLENLKKEYEEKYSLFQIPRPKYWGGFQLSPYRIEFWQGRPDRLHDRFEFTLEGKTWKKERLAP